MCSRVSRLSKWYRMLGHAFTGNNAYRNLLEELIAAQEKKRRWFMSRILITIFVM